MILYFLLGNPLVSVLILIFFSRTAALVRGMHRIINNKVHYHPNKRNIALHYCRKILHINLVNNMCVGVPNSFMRKNTFWRSKQNNTYFFFPKSTYLCWVSLYQICIRIKCTNKMSNNTIYIIFTKSSSIMWNMLCVYVDYQEYSFWSWIT